MPKLETNKTQLTRGYTIAFISAAIFSTTAIFIRYLTQTYHLPALVLAFWREIVVTLSLIIGLGMFKRSLLRVERKHLQSYLNELEFRHNRRFWPFSAFQRVLSIGLGVGSLTYRDLYDADEFGQNVHVN